LCYSKTLLSVLVYEGSNDSLKRSASRIWETISRVLGSPPVALEIGLCGAILLSAAAFRLYHLDLVPPGLQHDEIFKAKGALRILDGTLLVYSEPNAGELPLFMYVVALSFQLLGKNLLAIRLAAVACGLAGILVSWLLARELFGRWVGLLSAAFLAVSFWHVFDSRVGLEPIMVPLMATSSFYFLWLGLHRGGYRFFALAGLCLGLSTYTYHSGILVPVTAFLFVLYLLVIDKGLVRKHLKGLTLLFATALLVFAPMGHYVLTHSQVPMARVSQLSHHLGLLLSGDPRPVLEDGLKVAGMFSWQGDPEWRYNVAGRPVFDWITAVAFYVGLLICVLKVKTPQYSLLLLWLPVNLLASAVTPPSPSSLRALGAIVPIYLMPALAIVALGQWAAKRRGTVGAYGVGVATIVLLAFTAASTYRDYFVIWAQNDEVRRVYRADLAEVARYLSTQEESGVVCISAQFAADLDQEAFYFALGRGWSVKWFNGRSALVFPNEALPGDVTYVFPATSLLDEEMLERFFGHLPPAKEALDPQGRLVFLAYRLGASEMRALRSVQPQYPLAANLGNQVELLGYDLPPSVQAGQSVRLVLYYRIPSELGGWRNYSFFAHLVDGRGYLWGQDDAFGYPTSNWYGGDIVVQWLDVPIPPDAPPRSYHLKVGLYDQDRGQPFSVLAEDGSPMATAVTLEPLSVGKAAVPPPAAGLGIPNSLQARVGDLFTFLGYDVSQRVLNPGRSAHVSLYWQVTAKPDRDYLVSTYLVDEGGKVWPQSSRQALDGDYPTSLWEAGQVVRDRFDLVVDPETPRAVYELRVGLYDEETQSYLPVVVSSEGGVPSESVSLGQMLVRSRQRQFAVPPIENPLTACFGEVVSLLGYDLEEDEIAPDDVLHLTLYWQAQQQMDVSYTVFVHLLDTQNHIWGQRDSVPDGGQYLTTGWLEGEVVEDEYEIPVDPAAQSGEYLIEVGLYDAAQPGYPRLPVLDEQGQIIGDRVLLREVRIKP
jgi:4-amino-4-deoxy-L-arabinose transferase-like glycosyltransferase